MDRFKQRALHDKEYMGHIKDIYFSKSYQIMDTYPHHDKYTRLDHCLHVSYSVFLWLKKYVPGYKYMREACRGALLHDFFLYEWHTENPFPVPCMHAWKHPEKAYLDAIKHFKLNAVEKDIILTHMFPISIEIPLTKAAWAVVMFDKYWAFKEGIKNFDPVKMMKMQVPDAVKDSSFFKSVSK